MKQLAHLVFLLGAADSATHVWLERNSDTQSNLSFEVFVRRALGDCSWNVVGEALDLRKFTNCLAALDLG